MYRLVKKFGSIVGISVILLMIFTSGFILNFVPSVKATSSGSSVWLVGAGADDGGVGDEAFSNSRTYLYVSYTGTVEKTWLRFTNVDIDSGSSITSANWTGLFGDTTGPDMSIWAFDENDATNPTDASDLDSRAKTTAYVNWTLTGGTGWNISPDISSVIQEVVNRAGWVSGNAIVLYILGGFGGGADWMRSYNYGAAQAAKLAITWSVGGDFVAPTYSDITINETRAGYPVHIDVKWADDVGLDSVIFGLNTTGTFVNNTFLHCFTTNPEWVNGTSFQPLNDTAGNYEGWQMWVNDTSGNWNTTGFQAFLLTDGDTPTFQSSYPGPTQILANNVVYGVWKDNVALSGGIVGHNNSGTWYNYTWHAYNYFNPSTSNYYIWNQGTPFINNATVGARIEYRFWVNDTSNNWADSGIRYFLTTNIPDTWKPTYSDITVYPTYAGQTGHIDVYWNDTYGLSKVIFGTNNTGTWVNQTATAFSSTPEWVNVTYTINSTVGSTVQWRMWANDTSNNWNNTGIQSFVTIYWDDVLPTYSGVTVNNTRQGESGHIDVKWADNIGLSTGVFGSNLTGTWVNVTFVFSINPEWVNITGFTNPPDVGTYVIWEMWANDTNNNWANTGIQSFIVTISAPTYSGIIVYGPTIANPPYGGVIGHISVKWQDNAAISGWIFGSNNTGAWANTTWGPFWGPYLITGRANITDTWNAIPNTIAWQMWCNDTSNNWADTGLRTFKPVFLTVTFLTATGGTMTPTGTNTTVIWESVIPLTSTPAANYTFNRWDTTGRIWITGNDATIRGDGTIRAVFHEDITPPLPQITSTVWLVIEFLGGIILTFFSILMFTRVSKLWIPALICLVGGFFLHIYAMANFMSIGIWAAEVVIFFILFTRREVRNK